MTLPSLPTTSPPSELLAALQLHGAVLVTAPDLPAERCDRALADARQFFALDESAKDALAIERSPQFRGYSRMHNERDWREQMHFGPERPLRAAPASEPWWQLTGPNAWPPDRAFRDRIQDYQRWVQRIGERLLHGIATEFGLDHRRWLGPDPYVLLKCIGYHAQPDAAERRRGVAAHLDFSLLTLTLQDDVGGLQVRTPSGQWCTVPPRPGSWLVNVGELLQFVTGNRLLATPHRVENPSQSRQRCSLPLFLSPSLDTTLTRELPLLPMPTPPGDHVHAVLDPNATTARLHYGAAEWRRKGRNGWCHVCAPARDG
ncbi:MAG: hypothetical protein MUC36_19525 [Planctomycetes bacterium]|nr:hypothetical protein [Planctomycetota bacterium]